MPEHKRDPWCDCDACRDMRPYQIRCAWEEDAAEIRNECDTLRSALSALVGTSNIAELQAMESTVRELAAPDCDKASMLNAIRLLIASARRAT